jgi:cytochrome c nitrite reductase small subunit
MKPNLPARFLTPMWRALAPLVPPRQWRVPVIIAAGVFSGLGALAFHISNASSYLTDDPKACVNCHIMAPQYATWQRSAHGRVTVCNDCHVPHGNVLLKYGFKALDGTRHAFMFTFRLEPEVIRMHAPGQWTVQNNCIRCHRGLSAHVSNLAVSRQAVMAGAGKLCWDCHRETPHGRGNSAASTPHARVPELSPILPGWPRPGSRPPVPPESP